MNEIAIIISRRQQYALPGQSVRFAWRWVYSYKVPNKNSVTYGTHLGSLRDMLKRSYPGIRITENWK